MVDRILDNVDGNKYEEKEMVDVNCMHHMASEQSESLCAHNGHKEPEILVLI